MNYKEFLKMPVYPGWVSGDNRITYLLMTIMQLIIMTFVLSLVVQNGFGFAYYSIRSDKDLIVLLLTGSGMGLTTTIAFLLNDLYCLLKYGYRP